MGMVNTLTAAGQTSTPIRFRDKETVSCAISAATLTGSVVLEASQMLSGGYHTIATFTGNGTALHVNDHPDAWYRVRAVAMVTNDTLVVTISEAAQTLKSFVDDNGVEIIRITDAGVVIPKLLTVTGAATMGAASFSGAVTMASTLSVTGGITASVSGDMTIDANLFVSESVTETATPWPDSTLVKLDHATVPILKSISIEQGKLYIVSQSDAGTAGHVVTITAGTVDGTNNTLTFDAQYETLVFFGIAAGRGIILNNSGSVGLSDV